MTSIVSNVYGYYGTGQALRHLQCTLCCSFCDCYLLKRHFFTVVQDDLASVSGRSVGVGSEAGELADIAADDAPQASAATAFGMYFLQARRMFWPLVDSAAGQFGYMSKKYSGLYYMWCYLQRTA